VRQQEVDLLLGHDDRHRPQPQPLAVTMQRHAFRVGHPHRFIALTDRNAYNRHTVTKARNAVTPFQKRRFRRGNTVSELKRRYFVAGP
jgi:hypothetical protein